MRIFRLVEDRKRMQNFLYEDSESTISEESENAADDEESEGTEDNEESGSTEDNEESGSAVDDEELESIDDEEDSESSEEDDEWESTDSSEESEGADDDEDLDRESGCSCAHHRSRDFLIRRHPAFRYGYALRRHSHYKNPRKAPYIYHLPFPEDMIDEHIQTKLHRLSPRLYYREVEKMIRDVEGLWLKEKCLITGSRSNVASQLVFIHKYCKLENETKGKIKRLRWKTEHLPLSVESLTNVTEKDVFHRLSSKDLYPTPRGKWKRRYRLDKAYEELQGLFEKRLDRIIKESASWVRNGGEFRMLNKMEKMKEFLLKRFKHLTAEYPTQEDNLLMCRYCNFMRIQKERA